MFAFSFKVTAKRAMVVCAAIGCVALGACLLRDSVNATVQETATTVATENCLKLPKVRNNEERIAVLKELNWEVEQEPVEIEEIVIPENFDDVYENYNKIQKEMGLDLSKYKGKRCKKYTYAVTNYPDKEPMWVDIIVYKDKIIGGDVGTRKLGGFMQSLIREKQE